MVASGIYVMTDDGLMQATTAGPAGPTGPASTVPGPAGPGGSDAGVAGYVNDPASATKAALSAAYAALHSAVYHDPTAKANGTPAGTTDSGQAVTLFTGSTTLGAPDAFTYRSGKLAIAAYNGVAQTDFANHAVYYQVDAGAVITSIKAFVTWPVASIGGSQIAIVLPAVAWGIPTPGINTAPMHFVASGNGQWHCSEYVNTNTPAERVYGSDLTLGRFAAQNTGVECVFEFFIDHVAGTVTILFPDGSTARLADSALAAHTGTRVIYEVFMSGAVPDAPPVFGRITAGTQQLTYDSPVQTKATVISQIATVKRIVKEWSGAVSSGDTIRPGCIGVFVDLIAPGGGGGSGARGAAATIRSGGSGGGSGGVMKRIWVPASALGGSYYANIGAAGTGGAAQGTNTTAGVAGTAGLGVTFTSTPTTGPVTLLRALSGGGGGGGAIGAAGAAGGSGLPNGFVGLTASATGALTAAQADSYTTFGAYSGPGGGITTADVPSAGTRGSSNYCYGLTTGSSSTGGVVDGAVPLGGPVAQADRPGDGAGGGAASITTAAQAGADALGYGTGGGGGGASLNGNNSGKGGAGGPGYIRVEQIFA